MTQTNTTELKESLCRASCVDSDDYCGALVLLQNVSKCAGFDLGSEVECVARVVNEYMLSRHLKITLSEITRVVGPETHDDVP